VPFFSDDYFHDDRLPFHGRTGEPPFGRSARDDLTHHAVIYDGNRFNPDSDFFIECLFKMKPKSRFLLFMLAVVAVAGTGDRAFGSPSEGIVSPSPAAGFTLQKLVRISQESLAQKIRDKKDEKYFFTLVDTRNEADYQKGHIPGAINIPLGKMRFVAERVLDKEKDVVCYGYSRDDQASVDAVIFLANRNYNHVMFFEDGAMGWKGVWERNEDKKGV
jgi:rhodanese-related sulfurtransferase